MAPGSVPRWVASAECQRQSRLRACGETIEPEIPRRSFVPAFIVTTPCERLGIGTTLLALKELPLDVVLGDKFFNGITEDLRHRHRFDEIGAGFGEGFPLCGVDGDGRYSVRPGALRRAEHDPHTRRARRKMLAI